VKYRRNKQNPKQVRAQFKDTRL